MKIRVLGEEHSRYALILMLKDQQTDKCVDDTIRYYRNNNLDKLLDLKSDLIRTSLESKYDNIKFDISIYDYHEAQYIREAR